MSNILFNCQYIENQIAEVEFLDGPENISDFLSKGFYPSQYTGRYYKKVCSDCNKCQNVRILINDFKFSKSQKRVIKNGNNLLKRKIEIYTGFDLEYLTLQEKFVSRKNYLKPVSPTPATHIFEYRDHDNKLAIISYVIIDNDILYAYATHWNPVYSKYSLGKYSLLKQIEWCKENNKSYLYVGHTNEKVNAYKYKENFLPQERLIKGKWVKYED